MALLPPKRRDPYPCDNREPMIKERMINVTKIQPTKLSILLRFYFHDFLAQLKTNIHTNFRFERVLGFVIDSLCTDAPLHSVKTEKRRLSPRFFLIRTGGEGRGGRLYTGYVIEYT